MSSNNELNISINISDELLGKLMTVAMASASPMPLPQMLGALLSEQPPPEKKEKTPMGFRSPEEK